MTQDWEEVAKAKRESNLSKIPSKWLLDHIPTLDEEPNALTYLNKILPAKVVQITTKTATELLPLLRSGELTSFEVTEAFCHRAALAHQLTNCLTEIFFDRALEDAKKLDEHFKDHGVIGPLHGLPISLKDQVNLEGIDTSIGYTAAFINDEYQKLITGRGKEDKVNSVLAIILQKAGAVFYVKTTVPMAMLAGDTTTGLFGDTLNAINRHFSPGGSSGGEGALIGCGGSCLGFGTDIGGSIRIPSSFNGLFGLRPSSNRIPYMDVANSMAHQPIVPSVIGPMAHSVDDLQYVTKVIIDSKPWDYDPKVPPIVWRDIDTEGKTFNFGVMEFDGVVTAHPLFKRAIGIVKKLLLSHGHDLFNFEPPVDHSKIVKLVGDIFAADSMDEVMGFAKLSGEPIGDVVLDLCPPPWKPYSVSDHWEQLKGIYEFQQQYNSGWWRTCELTQNGKPMDAYITPSWTSTSFKVGRHRFSPSTYTQYLNGLDYSVVVIPVTTVDKEIDHYPEGYEPINARDEMNFKEYNPEEYHGLPVCIQLVCKKYQEEKVLALAKVIVNCLN